MRIVDLTLPINRHMTGIPGIKEYIENPTRCVVLSALSDDHLAQIRESGLETLDEPEITHHMMSRLEIVGHIGTHIDAPIHFLENTASIDEVPLDSTIGKGRVIPLTDTEPGSAVTAEMVLATGVDFDGSVIPILHTGWTDRAWGTDRFWDEMVWLDVSVSELMVERGVKAVALDFFPEAPFWKGVFRGDGSPGPNHRMLLGNKAIIIQMLTNIGDIASDDFTLAGVPLRLEGLDGSPARVFAMIE
jgi:kynurenine formamidase